jgi:hypothetical protein
MFQRLDYLSIVKQIRSHLNTTGINTHGQIVAFYLGINEGQ